MCPLQFQKQSSNLALYSTSFKGRNSIRKQLQKLGYLFYILFVHCLWYIDHRNVKFWCNWDAKILWCLTPWCESRRPTSHFERELNILIFTLGRVVIPVLGRSAENSLYWASLGTEHVQRNTSYTTHLEIWAKLVEGPLSS